MFLKSDILPQLETMDISAGTLKDEGAQLLLDNMDKGIRKVICTDISCDGMLSGPSIDLYKDCLLYTSRCV